MEKATLKARGIRFSDKAWKKLSDNAEKISSTPSDIVRGIVDDHYAKSDGTKSPEKET